MADVVTGSGGRIFIGPAVASGDADSLAEFEAISPWTEVELVESISDYGDEANDVTFASLKDGRMRHTKGVRDGGTCTVVVGLDPRDPGQLALDEAQETNYKYAIKNVLADAPSSLYTNSIRYFRASVRSNKLGQQTSDAVLKITYMLGVDSEIFRSPSELI